MPQGPLAFIANTFQGAIGAGRIDPQRALWSTNRHGKYYASTYGTPAIVSPAKAAVAGSVFRGANQSSVTVSAGLATTYTGLCLSNPITSTVNLVIMKGGAVLTAAPSGQIGLGVLVGWAATGITVHTTPLNTSIINGYVGAGATGTVPLAGPASQANLDAACTLVGTPTWIDWLASNGAANSGASWFADSDSDIIIPPGGYIALGANASSGGFLGSLTWEELPP